MTMAHRKAAISRAIAVVATTAFIKVANLAKGKRAQSDRDRIGGPEHRRHRS